MSCSPLIWRLLIALVATCVGGLLVGSVLAQPQQPDRFDPFDPGGIRNIISTRPLNPPSDSNVPKPRPVSGSVDLPPRSPHLPF